MQDTNFPPNIDPQDFSLIAVLVAYALSGRTSALEQNSLGNWLMLVSQYMLAHSAQQQLIDSRNNNRSYFQNNSAQQHDINFLLKSIKEIYEELEKIKK